MNQYDTVGPAYISAKNRNPVDRLMNYPALLVAAGDVAGKSVLDLACGEGKVGRMLLVRGARSVLGIDYSPVMISEAVSRRVAGQNSIFRIGCVGQLGKVGQFDVIAAGWLLHYAASKRALYDMARDIAINLRPGGIFVALNGNPDCPTGGSPAYGYEVKPTTYPVQEGDALTLNVTAPGISENITIYHWEAETYRRAFAAAGIKLEITPILPDADAVRRMGASYWEAYQARPTSALFRGVQRSTLHGEASCG